MLVACIVPALLTAAPSRAELKACVEASERGQKARDELRFSDARREFLRCTQPTCPGVVQRDCDGWLTQLKADQPTVVVMVREEGRDVVFNSLRIDSTTVASRPGQPLELDPGVHALDVTLEDGRTSTQQVVVAAGEKNRRVVFEFTAGAKKIDLPVSGSLTPIAGVRQEPVAPKRSPLAALLLTGGGVASGALFGTFALLGRGELSKVESQPCAATRTCDPRQLENTRGLYAAADVAAGLAVAFLALAVWQWVVWATN